VKRFELWFDFSCPYAYLAMSQAEALAERTGTQLDLRPMLLGGVFKAREVPQNLFATMSPAKTRHNFADMQRWGRLFGLPKPLTIPQGHPVRTVDALRCVLAVGQPFGPLVRRFFEAYWDEQIDISSDEGLAQVLKAAGHEPADILAKARSPQIKDELRARTDEAIERGIFGAPAIFVGDKLYWGQDRLHFVERALGGVPMPMAPPQEELQHPVDFYFDYSSPFAYLASTEVEATLGDKATWRPMLLGAVFKAVQMANVPFFTMSEAKRAYYAKDIARQAGAAQAKFTWPSNFPMNTVLALRMTLLARAHETAQGRQFVHRVFRAYWAEDLDISQGEVLAKIASECGLDGPALVEGASAPDIKAALKTCTQDAVEAGVFGAPTFVVHGDEGPNLYWGADRLAMAARAAAGDTRVQG